jgi:hypothetical protein
MSALIAAGACLLLASGAHASKKEKAEELTRDAQRLSQIKTIAAMPVVPQFRIDGEDRIDPNRMAMRQAVMTNLPDILDAQMKSGSYTLLPPEVGVLALKDANIDITDIYVATKTGSFDSPADTITNKEKDEVRLLNTRDAMKKNPEDITLFKYTARDLPGAVIGLASEKKNPDAKLDPGKVKALVGAVKADAVLICRIANLEIHTSGNGSLAMPYHRNTEMIIDFTLVATSDGAVVWEARAKGTKHMSGGVGGGLRKVLRENDRPALDSATEATGVLIDDLINGGGEQPKEKKK